MRTTTKSAALIALAILLSLFTSCTKDEPILTSEVVTATEISQEVIDIPTETVTEDLDVFETWDLSKDALAFLASDYACELTDEEIEEISRSCSVTFFRQLDWVVLEFTDIVDLNGNIVEVEIDGNSYQTGYSNFGTGTSLAALEFFETIGRITGGHETNEVLYSNNYELLTYQFETLVSASALDLDMKVRVVGGTGIFDDAKGMLNRRVIPDAEIGYDYTQWSSNFNFTTARVMHNGWLCLEDPITP